VFNAGAGFALLRNYSIRHLKSGFNYNKAMKFSAFPNHSFAAPAAGLNILPKMRTAEFFAQTPNEVAKNNYFLLDLQKGCLAPS
jgi:hypothetical protein